MLKLVYNVISNDIKALKGSISVNWINYDSNNPNLPHCHTCTKTSFCTSKCKFGDFQVISGLYHHNICVIGI